MLGETVTSRVVKETKQKVCSKEKLISRGNKKWKEKKDGWTAKQRRKTKAKKEKPL